MDEQRQWFLGMEFTGEDAVKIVEMTKDLEYYINLVDKAVSGFGRIDSNFERSSTVGKYYQNSIDTIEKSFMKGRVHRCSKFHCLIFRNCHCHPQPSAPTTLLSQQPTKLRQDPASAKRL